MTEVERLSTKVRRLERIVFVLVVGFGAVLVMGQAAPSPGAMTVKSLHMQDYHGRERIRLEASGWPSLAILDESGHARARMVVASEGPILMLADTLGTVRTSMAVLNGKSAFTLGPDRSSRIVLGIPESPSGGLTIAGAGGQKRIALLLSNGEPSLTLYDSTGQATNTVP